MEKKENELVERRENKRHCIPAVVTCTFFEEVLTRKGSLQGIIQDISFGGVSIEISFSGIVKWYKRVKKKDKNALYLKIQFHNLDEKSAEMLKKYLSLGSGDKNLIWNLWDNLSRTP
jgi:hypothetical protein